MPAADGTGKTRPAADGRPVIGNDAPGVSPERQVLMMASDQPVKIVIVDENPIRTAILEEGLRDADMGRVVDHTVLKERHSEWRKSAGR